MVAFLALEGLYLLILLGGCIGGIVLITDHLIAAMAVGTVCIAFLVQFFRHPIRTLILIPVLIFLARIAVNHL